MTWCSFTPPTRKPAPVDDRPPRPVPFGSPWPGDGDDEDVYIIALSRLLDRANTSRLAKMAGVAGQSPAAVACRVYNFNAFVGQALRATWACSRRIRRAGIFSCRRTSSRVSSAQRRPGHAHCQPWRGGQRHRTDRQQRGNAVGGGIARRPQTAPSGPPKRERKPDASQPARPSRTRPIRSVPPAASKPALRPEAFRGPACNDCPGLRRPGKRRFTSPLRTPRVVSLN